MQKIEGLPQRDLHKLKDAGLAPLEIFTCRECDEYVGATETRLKAQITKTLNKKSKTIIMILCQNYCLDQRDIPRTTTGKMGLLFHELGTSRALIPPITHNKHTRQNERDGAFSGT